MELYLSLHILLKKHFPQKSISTAKLGEDRSKLQRFWNPKTDIFEEKFETFIIIREIMAFIMLRSFYLLHGRDFSIQNKWWLKQIFYAPENRVFLLIIHRHSSDTLWFLGSLIPLPSLIILHISLIRTLLCLKPVISNSYLLYIPWEFNAMMCRYRSRNRYFCYKFYISLLPCQNKLKFCLLCAFIGLCKWINDGIVTCSCLCM